LAQETIRVELGERSYPIVVTSEPLSGLGVTLAGALAPGRLAVIADARVAERYGAAALASLEAAGFAPRLWPVPPGERSKRLGRAERLARALVSDGVDRRTAVLAFGGGVVSDLAGFVAATLLRGLDWAAAATTLLSQVDAAIGGKTGVNLPEGKNLVGAFHQPRAVVALLPLLATLSGRELRSGLGEVVKYGVIAAPALLDEVRRAPRAVRAAEPAALLPLVARCAAIKAAVVARDERETRGERVVLNFGHTVGHALEARHGFHRLRHGEAVALGMVAAADVTARLGLGGAETARALRATLGALGLPVDWRAWLDEAALALLGTDKKREGRTISFVAAPAPGRTEVVPLALDELKRLLAAAG
jgi:shikimate kinase/3-dehydroquinate synthase